VRVPGAFPAAEAAEMRRRVWEVLERRYGFREDAPETWTGEQPTQLGTLARSVAFAAIGSTRLCAAIDAILGPGAWQRPQNWGAPLVTFPTRGREWNVPHAQWHMDFPPAGVSGVVLRLKMFSYLAPVRAHGGGTVILSGSHRLVARVLNQAAPETAQ